jgi:hypothetical protein
MNDWVFSLRLEVVKMQDLEKKATIFIRIFGSLRQYIEDQRLSASFEKEIHSKEISAYDLAKEISLPPEKIEAVFRNGRIINIHDPVFPGDRVAFCPYGTPGPYRVFLGMARENEKRKHRERSNMNE